MQLIDQPEVLPGGRPESDAGVPPAAVRGPAGWRTASANLIQSEHGVHDVHHGYAFPEARGPAESVEFA